MAKFCEQCGTPITGSTKFCPECGFAIKSAPSKQTPPVQQQIPPVQQQTPPVQQAPPVQNKPSSGERTIIIILYCAIAVLVLALAGYFVYHFVSDLTKDDDKEAAVSNFLAEDEIATSDWSEMPEVSDVQSETESVDENVNSAATLSDFSGMWKGTATCTLVSGVEENRQALLDMGASAENIDMIAQTLGTQTSMDLSILPSGEWNVYIPVVTGALNMNCKEMMTEEERDSGQVQKYYVAPENGVFSINSLTKQEEGNATFCISGAMMQDNSLEGKLNYGMEVASGYSIDFEYTYKLTYAGPIDENGQPLGGEFE